MPATVSISRSGLVKYELLDPRLKGLKVTVKNAGNSIILGLKQPETTDPYGTVVKLTF